MGGPIKTVKAIPGRMEKPIDRDAETPNPKGGKATCT